MTDIKETPILFSPSMVCAILEGRKTQTRRVVSDVHIHRMSLETQKYAKCDYESGPYGKPGDRLWVRETWTEGYGHGFENIIPDTIYRADYLGGAEHHWHPSIHMPRWRSRITLEVTSTRVDRLQDISNEDIKAEGVTRGMAGPYIPQTHFASVWNAINEKRGYTWQSNPYVWVVSFKRLTP